MHQTDDPISLVLPSKLTGTNFAPRILWAKAGPTMRLLPGAPSCVPNWSYLGININCYLESRERVWG